MAVKPDIVQVAFEEVFGRVSRAVNDWAHKKGWWDAPTEDGTKIALIHSDYQKPYELPEARKPTFRPHPRV